MNTDIRWLQRFANLKKAFSKLDQALQISQPSEVERAGIIQMFEFTSELAWNTLKDLLEYQGENGIIGGREAIRLAFQKGVISDGLSWLKMLSSRKLSSHTYNESIAQDLLKEIRETYHGLFKDLINYLNELAAE